ncbi:MAG TPA: TIM44-like domain-containing protein [Bacteroidia bacterium]|nr:TIM44-like domain-containing protein [Bacteroidia bacterium]
MKKGPGSLSGNVNARIIFFILFVLAGMALYASAGGGGGGGSDRDSSGLLGTIIYYLFWLIPFPWNFVTIGAIIVIFYLARKKTKTFSGLNRIASFDSMGQQASAVSPEFLQRNPSFNEQGFLAKVSTAFSSIQVAWMNMDLSGVRRWISDGVWQRFNTQFVMMKKLGQKNTMEDIRIQGMHIDRIESDGQFDIIHVGIHFTMMDNFITEKYPQLNVAGRLENVEYWSFIRKSGVAEKDLYHSQNCPNCGAALPEKMGETSKCEHCGTTTTLGDYDWVLSEISQAADYRNESAQLAMDGSSTAKIRQAMAGDKSFSIQSIEDKASNAYMQIMSALVTKQPERMRRFVDDKLFGQLSERIKTEPPFVFNRLFLNNVTVMNHYAAEGKDNLVVMLKRTAQRVSVESGQLQLIDYAPYAVNEMMILSRDAGAGDPKGSLYAHSCPSCGGPLTDTLDMNCPYCGSLLNSTKTEWIVTRFDDAQGYSQLRSEGAQLATEADVEDMDALFKVRDYAFNNVMVIIAADGLLHEEEIKFANQLAVKLGYDKNKIAGMIDLARNRQLVIRMPESRKKCEKVYRIMEKAAAADGNVSEEERSILDDVKKHIEYMNA